MLHKARSEKDVRRKVSPPGPSFMNDVQMSDYLASLRKNRPTRPSGARPPPIKAKTIASPMQHYYDADPVPTPIAEEQMVTALPPIDDHDPTLMPPALHRRAKSDMSVVASINKLENLTRPLVRDSSQNSYSVRGRKVSPTAVVQPRAPSGGEYRESGARWMERQEALSLRSALEEMDLKDEEKRIHDAAKDEAADLVWKHQNPRSAEEEKTSAYRNPDLPSVRFNEHLKKGAHARSQSQSYGEVAKRMPRSDSSRSVSGSSTSSNGARQSMDIPRTRNQAPIEADMAGDYANSEPKTDTMDAAAGKGARKPSASRNISSGSAKGLFRNPEDQIYEEPQDEPVRANSPHVRFQPPPLQVKQRNSLPRGSRPLPTSTDSFRKRFNPFEIHRNPPTQSRNAEYTKNEPVQSPPVIQVNDERPASKDGKEIRGDDIRAATSVKLKDRSPKLPTPTAVSDRPGRPIVSFSPAWQPNKTPAQDSPPSSKDSNATIHRAMSVPTFTVSVADEQPPPVPAIVLPEDAYFSSNPAQSVPSIPTINVDQEDSVSAVPTINVRDKSLVSSQPKPPSARPLPNPSSTRSMPAIPTISVDQKESVPPVPTMNLPDKYGVSSQPKPPSARPLPNRASTRPLPDPSIGSQGRNNPRLPWLNRNQTLTSRAGVPTATCANCSLPIAGRVVTASGSGNNSSQKARFHPECFTCFHCSTALEAAEFYPEPDNKRIERMETEGLNDGDYGSELRFYCHLDFHEFFSPRCKNCKTPIEGEVIVAAGSEWHVGHFFCAECGDPFDSTKPFVEKDGYAWCVSCHTRRTSSRCRGCKKPVLDEITITALGGQWHADCFVCLECGSDFGDEGRFFVREIPAEQTEKERRRGLKPKMEERGVCEGCEQRRLKA